MPENSSKVYGYGTVEHSGTTYAPHTESTSNPIPSQKQEHWSPDSVPRTQPLEASVPQRISGSETAAANWRLSGETETFAHTPPVHPKTSANVAPFDFDENDLSDEEDATSRLISFHKTKVSQCLNDGRFDYELHKHLKELVKTHKIGDTVLAVYLAISLLRKCKDTTLVLRLLSEEFKFVATVEPEINLAGYLLRAQASLLESQPSSGLKDCRRAIKLVEKYKAAGVGGEAKESLFDRFRNSAYRIAALCGAKLSNDIDKRYYETMHQPATPWPFLQMGPKILINLEFLDNSGKWQDVENLMSQSVETELEDDLLEQTRAQRFRGIDSGITIYFQIPPWGDNFLNTVYGFGGAEVNPYPNRNGKNILFPQRNKVLELLDFCLKRDGSNPEADLNHIAQHICYSNQSALRDGIFTFEHPMIDPFSYHPPYAGLANTQILVDKAFTLLAKYNHPIWVSTLYKGLFATGANGIKEQADMDPVLDKILESAFRIAIFIDNIEFINCVIGHHPYKIDLTDDSKGLIHAVIRSSWSGNTTILRQMLGRANPNIHSALSNGGNVFHYAAYYSINYASAMECLLEYHRCRECLHAKMTFRGSRYTPYQMASLARPKHRLLGDNEKLVGEIKALMEKLAGPWVKDDLGTALSVGDPPNTSAKPIEKKKSPAPSNKDLSRVDLPWWMTKPTSSWVVKTVTDAPETPTEGSIAPPSTPVEPSGPITRMEVYTPTDNQNSLRKPQYSRFYDPLNKLYRPTPARPKQK
ncbi:hypothetical protein TWF281_003673 [Arthrobotrys megalospora]